MDDERIVFVVPAEVVDKTEVDDVDTQFGVDDIFQRFDNSIKFLGGKFAHSWRILYLTAAVRYRSVPLVFEALSEFVAALFGHFTGDENVHEIG